MLMSILPSAYTYKLFTALKLNLNKQHLVNIILGLSCLVFALEPSKNPDFRVSISQSV